MSAKTGMPPRYSTALAEAAKVSGEVMTSSPGPIPAAKTAAWSAAVPEFTATACRASTTEADGPLEGLDGWTGREPVRAERRDDRLDVVVLDGLVRIGQQRRADGRAAVEGQRLSHRPAPASQVG